MRRILTLASVVVLGVGAAACGSDDDQDADGAAAAPTTAAGTADADTADADSVDAGTVEAEPADDTVAPTTAAAAPAERATIVVTTNILGDVVAAVVGDLADVEVIMPLGADPHDFAPSVKQAAAMEDADLLVVNGANFEEGMLGVIDSVADSGTPVFAFADAMTLLEGGAHDHGDDDHDHEGETTEGDTHDDHDDHDDHDHDGEKSEGDTHDHDHEGETHDDHDHDGEKSEDETHDDHDHGGLDPHLWTDPARMIDGVNGLAAALAAVEAIDVAAIEAQAEAYVAELEALDAEIEASLGAIPAEDRVLVTNHEVFAYFADRYGFEVVGAVVPSLTTSAETSVRELEELAAIIEAEGITAIFAETTQSTDLAEALAGEVGGDVAIVELFTESLGEPGSGAETYIDLMRTNAELIVAALTGA